jgi:hypothetical protein
MHSTNHWGIWCEAIYAISEFQFDPTDKTGVGCHHRKSGPRGFLDHPFGAQTPASQAHATGRSQPMAKAGQILQSKVMQ